MITSKSILIYFFSGTGNSRNVAKWISDVATTKGFVVTVENITEIDRLSIATPPADALIVFVSPVHGFNYPPVMLNFIARFPRGKNSVLLMNTRAGMLIGKYNTPGISGISFYLSSILLKMKGFSIVGMIPVDLPSNWISFHPGLNDRTIKVLHEKNKIRVMKSAEKVLSGKNDFRSLREIIQDIAFSPISIGYYVVGRFFLSKTFFASSDCNHCDLCIKECPVKAIIKIDNRPFWTFKCESCMRCMGHCPKKAIEAGHGFVIGYLLIFSSLSALFFNYFDSIITFGEHSFLRSIIKAGLFVFLVGLFYRLIHLLMRFKVIEKLVVYTSLTKYKFWGRRYRALKDQ